MNNPIILRLSILAIATAWASQTAAAPPPQQRRAQADAQKAQQVPPQQKLPTLHTKIGDFLFAVPGLARVTTSSVSPFQVDKQGHDSAGGPMLDTKLRLGLKIMRRKATCPWAFGLTYEHEFVNGNLMGGSDLAGEGIPHTDMQWQQWRQGFLTIGYKHWLKLDFGLQTSHWGMGLVANDDDHGATFGSGRFSVPFNSDRNLRASMTLLPFIESNSAVKGLALFVAGDSVWQDSNADFLDGDRAYQGILAVKWIRGPKGDVGLYMVRRLQQDDSGRRLQVSVADIAGTSRIAAGPGKFVIASEIAAITGNTSRGGSIDHPRQQVRQFGAAASVGYEMDDLGAWLDFVYASGDQNLYDGKQNAFKANKSFDVGMLMFDELLAFHTGRGVGVAGDPMVVGQPPDDIGNTATHGGISNAIVFSPRLSYRPLDWLETYGRPVLAWATVSPVDAYNTSTAGGGLARNALGAEPGTFYGVETDLGLRAKFDTGSLHVLTSLEGAALMPGNAFLLPDGSNLSTIYGARWNIGASF